MAKGTLLDDLEEAKGALEQEISTLRKDLLAREEALANLQKSIHALGKSSVTEEPRGTGMSRSVAVSGRRSRPSLSRRAGHYDHILYNGQLLEDAAQFLDHIGVPHYFSDVPGMIHKGDESQRQILAWARKNTNEARKVLLERADGSQASLWDFMLLMEWA